MPALPCKLVIKMFRSLPLLVGLELAYAEMVELKNRNIFK